MSDNRFLQPVLKNLAIDSTLIHSYYEYNNRANTVYHFTADDVIELRKALALVNDLAIKQRNKMIVYMASIMEKSVRVITKKSFMFFPYISDKTKTFAKYLNYNKLQTEKLVNMKNTLIEKYGSLDAALETGDDLYAFFDDKGISADYAASRIIRHSIKAYSRELRKPTNAAIFEYLGLHGNAYFKELNFNDESLGDLFRIFFPDSFSNFSKNLKVGNTGGCSMGHDDLIQVRRLTAFYNTLSNPEYTRFMDEVILNQKYIEIIYNQE